MEHIDGEALLLMHYMGYVNQITAYSEKDNVWQNQRISLPGGQTINSVSCESGECVQVSSLARTLVGLLTNFGMN